MSTGQTLIEMRRDAADRKFEDFDFGTSNVEDMEGWEFENDGDQMTRTVYFEDSEDPDADSVRGHFNVRFETGSAVIADAYGVLGGATFEDKPQIAGPRA
jgi:hypothetical protein